MPQKNCIQAPHRPSPVSTQIADMEECEAIELAWQDFATNIIVPI